MNARIGQQCLNDVTGRRIPLADTIKIFPKQSPKRRRHSVSVSRVPICGGHLAQVPSPLIRKTWPVPDMNAPEFTTAYFLIKFHEHRSRDCGLGSLRIVFNAEENVSCLILADRETELSQSIRDRAQTGMFAEDQTMTTPEVSRIKSLIAALIFQETFDVDAGLMSENSFSND